jgi:hypothetical protein
MYFQYKSTIPHLRMSSSNGAPDGSTVETPILCSAVDSDEGLFRRASRLRLPTIGGVQARPIYLLIRAKWIGVPPRAGETGVLGRPDSMSPMSDGQHVATQRLAGRVEPQSALFDDQTAILDIQQAGKLSDSSRFFRSDAEL